MKKTKASPKVSKNKKVSNMGSIFNDKIALLLISCIFFVSIFLNLYKINTLMTFIGDFGHDYLAAKDMLLTGNIPLLGIPSSVVWLRQGPLSIYFIGLSFLLGHFHPVAPAVFYAILGVGSTGLVFLLGRLLFNIHVGLLASLLYATSPLVVINARMPYHTASIPFFACVFFLLLYHVLKGNKKLLFLLFFFLGILFQLELSNAVLFFLLAVVWWFYKPVVTRAEIVRSVLGFSIGILPFILYDITHNFIQTGGFVLWVVNRIRLFFGLTLSGQSTTAHAQGALQTIWQQLERILFPQSQGINVLLLALLIIYLFMNRRKVIDYKRNIGLILVLLWIHVPLFGFFIHAAPGGAYFPLVFPPILLFGGLIFYWLSHYSKVFLFLPIVIALLNASFILQNEYFLTTGRGIHTIPPNDYSIGSTWTLQDTVVKSIVKDAGNKPFQLKGGGFFGKFPAGIDNYKYLAWWRGGKLTNDAKVIYSIYPMQKNIPKKERNVFTDGKVVVTKYEK